MSYPILNAQEIIDALACGRPGCTCTTSSRRGHGNIHCPAHEDPSPSLSVTTGNDGRILVHCFGGCSQDAVIAALRERGLWPERRSAPPNQARSNGRDDRRSVATYDYRDESGWLRYQVVRTDPKGFYQRRRNKNSNQPDQPNWINDMKGIKRILYNLPALAAADPDELVIVGEGEKDVDRLSEEGFLATTCPGGANAWKDEYARSLAGHPVAIIPDHDEAGATFGQQVARSSVEVAAWVKVVNLPGLGDGQDISDWFDQGGTPDDLRRRIDETPAWSPDTHEGDDVFDDEPIEPPPLPDLLEDVAGFIARYVVLTDHQRDTIAIWIAHTHAFDAADQTPYLSLTSAEKRSGKTRLLECLELLVARPWLTGRTTAAALVRKVDKDRPTLLLDESDAAFKGDKEYAESLRGILNTGHRRGGVASLCIGQGANIDVRDFSTFSPKVIAGIGKLPDTVTDRSIPIELKRKSPNEDVERFRWRTASADAKEIADGLRAWASGATDNLTGAEPELPDELDDRAQDGWEALLAIAELAGEDWRKRAWSAALALSADVARDDDSLGVRLLTDLRQLFSGDTDRLTTSNILQQLNKRDESPWGGFHDDVGMRARDLANILRRYEVSPKVIRLPDGTTPRGYRLDDLEDPFNRYLPATPNDKCNIRNIPVNMGKTDPQQAQQDPSMLRMESGAFPDSDADVADVADSEGGNGGMGHSTPAEDDDWDRWFGEADIKAAEELESEAANDEEWIDVDARHRSVPTSS